MASEVEICNLALGFLGDEANVSAITPPDGSAQAGYCHQFYPVARDAVLEAHNWGFALRRAALAVVTTTETPAEWAYCYQHPNCIRVVAVYPPDTTVSSSNAIFDQTEFLNRQAECEFVVETLSTGSKVIYSNMENATSLYIAKVTDTAKFTPGVTLAVARLLASYVAGPLLKGKEGSRQAKEQMEMYLKIDLPNATSADAKSGYRKRYSSFMPAGLAARG